MRIALVALLVAGCGGKQAAPTAPEEAPVTGPTKVEAPRLVPYPLTAEELTVGTPRTLVILVVSDGPEADDLFQIGVSTFTGLRMPINEWRLGCQPAAMAAVGKDGDRRVGSLSFRTRADADHYVMGKGLTPIAIVDDTVQACDD